jgi:hypothetical protein
VVRTPIERRVWDLLSPSDRATALKARRARRRVGEIDIEFEEIEREGDVEEIEEIEEKIEIEAEWTTRAPLYVSLVFVERANGACRPVLTDPCAPVGREQWSRSRECIDVCISLTEPESSDCDTCCETCCDASVLLARVDQELDGCDLVGLACENDVRRMLSRHQLATITGISWYHGAYYDREIADDLLHTGLALRFSRPVRVDTIEDGVVDLLVYPGPTGFSGVVQFRAIELQPGREHDGLTDELWIRDITDDDLSGADRVLIRVRADFLLDACCRAVDGNNIGGRVPHYDPVWTPFDDVPHAEPLRVREYHGCEHPPDRNGRWTSGNGTEGDPFESWFFIEPAPRPTSRKRSTS